MIETLRVDQTALVDPIVAKPPTLNLIVYLGLQNRESDAHRAHAVAESLPARLLLIDPGADARAFAPIDSGERETMVLPVASRRSDDVGRFVAAALTRTLPTAIWWASEERIDARFIAELSASTNGIVLDSSKAELDRLDQIAYLRTRFRKIAVRDLAWARTSGWRDAIAKVFDAPRAAAELRSLQRIELAGSSAGEARYVLGWMASRLGWRLGRDLDATTRDGRAVEVVFRRETEARSLREVCIADERLSITLSVTENDEAVTVAARDASGAVDTRVLPYTHQHDATLVEHAILYQSSDELFEAALRTLCDTE